jgi:hypothetical protein
MFEHNRALCSKYSADLISAIDVGYIEIYREYAFKKFKTDYILNLDPDETPSPEFCSSLKNLTSADVYYIPRTNSRLEYYEFVPRLFKKKSVIWRGYIHELPVLKDKNYSKIIKLPRELSILHKINERQWISEKSRGQRYFHIESITRAPVLHSYLNTYSFKTPKMVKEFYNRFESRKIINRSFLKFIMKIYEIKGRIIAPDSLKSYQFYKDYNLWKLEYFLSLSEKLKEMYISWYFDIYNAGGPTFYLRFEDEEYLESLGKSSLITYKGNLFEFLISYRYKNRSWWGYDMLPLEA